MPTKIRRLKEEAIDACTWRGHKMVPFYKIPLNQIHLSRVYFTTHCEKCKMEVTVTPNPLPNEIDICGSAVALNCGDK